LQQQPLLEETFECALAMAERDRANMEVVGEPSYLHHSREDAPRVHQRGDIQYFPGLLEDGTFDWPLQQLQHAVMLYLIVD
jgi:hypothetical protein